MKKITLLLILLLPLNLHAVRLKKVLDQWLGAPETELVNKWGYPETKKDVERISNEAKIYSYRYAACIVSFTINEGIVVNWKYRGKGCSKIKRLKKIRRQTV